jgi:hypothetical protein
MVGMELRVIKRKCLVCGKVILISVKENGAYKGGHYFGRMRFQINKEKEKEVEYWECEKCYLED